MILIPRYNGGVNLELSFRRPEGFLMQSAESAGPPTGAYYLYVRIVRPGR